jgi:putative transposase
VAFIDAHRDRLGVEPICKVLQVAPSTYYAARNRPPCRRQLRDEELKADIRRVFADNYSSYVRGRSGDSSTGRAFPSPGAPWSG